MLLKAPWIGTNHSQSSKASSTNEDSRQPVRTTKPSSGPTALNQSFNSSHPSDPSPRKLCKRPRILDDSESEERKHVPRKKRRIRLELVTSWLSRPYAIPTTHIVGTRAGRIGVWARQRLAGGKLLRKAALLNSVAMKRKRDSREVVNPSSLPRSTSARETDTPARFMGTEDYDAFDYEEDYFEEDVDDDEDEGDLDDLDDGQQVHSDFHMLASSDSDDGEFCDATYSFDTPNTGYQPAVDPGGKAIDLIMETERQDEVSVAPTSCISLPHMVSKLTMIGGRTA